MLYRFQKEGGQKGQMETGMKQIRVRGSNPTIGKTPVLVVSRSHSTSATRHSRLILPNPTQRDPKRLGTRSAWPRRPAIKTIGVNSRHSRKTTPPPLPPVKCFQISLFHPNSPHASPYPPIRFQTCQPIKGYSTGGYPRKKFNPPRLGLAYFISSYQDTLIFYLHPFPASANFAHNNSPLSR
jgi:hypothetical protein